MGLSSGSVESKVDARLAADATQARLGKGLGAVRLAVHFGASTTGEGDRGQRRDVSILMV